MPPDPRLLEAFERLFAAMGITNPEAKAELGRRVFASEALHEKLQALAARFVAEADPDHPGPRTRKEP